MTVSRHKEIRRLAKLLLVSWLLGLLSAAIVFFPFSHLTAMIALKAVALEPRALLTTYVGFLPDYLIATFTVGTIISLPFLAIAALIAFLLKNRIERFPVFFILLAPTLSACSVAAFRALQKDNIWAETHNYLERFETWLLDSETWIFAMSVTVAAIYFCLSLSRGKS